MANILITGGTGLVGTRLTRLLLERKHKVRVLSRSPALENEFKWDVSKGFIAEEALENVDYIIHLAGAGIADKRWTKDRKKILIDSRVKTANLLFQKIKERNIVLKGFISSSGSNYYGATTTDRIHQEASPVGTDFLGVVCQQWEAAANQFLKLDIPVTILRTGVVLSKKGGALEKMKTPVISPLGSGKQFMPWIHIDDLCALYIKTVEENIVGIYNAVAPEHANSTAFSKTLANVLKRVYVPIAVPGFLLKLVFGELAIILLEGSRLSSEKIGKKGFVFKYGTLKLALKSLL
ncbi:hypothetical protein PI23P_07255 [Polaribacter irgensii 23-P]|uniref:TIGR01777 family protein n=1 Tax=Polaribacter irgensii 23-P TaxID=313594 RepID=A4BZ10_9FLAO|nr:TIGR01777 family oxidoreductase [Polaribacter irgensii]EAR12403.1 hypothetical protein PI23P_07255 [Polaribacter irgensii 23-P]